MITLQCDVMNNFRISMHNYIISESLMQAMSVTATPTLTPLGTTPADIDPFDLSRGAYKEHRELLQSVLRGGR